MEAEAETMRWRILREVVMEVATEVVTKGGLKSCQNSCKDRIDENLCYLCEGGTPLQNP